MLHLTAGQAQPAAAAAAALAGASASPHMDPKMQQDAAMPPAASIDGEIDDEELLLLADTQVVQPCTR